MRKRHLYDVSIHALLAECDLRLFVGVGANHAVSIHALLAECDASIFLLFSKSYSFNPRTPCGVRPASAIKAEAAEVVSIHALLAECDKDSYDECIKIQCFNPRTPCGVRRTENSDCGKEGECFNPRTPCGVRHLAYELNTKPEKFQSTHSLRSATTTLRPLKNSVKFQSTHSLRSATRPRGRPRLSSMGFNPRTPCGVRHDLDADPGGQIRFNPRTPCGVRPFKIEAFSGLVMFQSTHSLRSATSGT